ncbi:hypothetical protein BGX34_003409, partial [Mortierella sp. NVP85]
DPEKFMDQTIRDANYPKVKTADLTTMVQKLFAAPAAAATTQEKSKRRSWGKMLEWGGIRGISS